MKKIDLKAPIEPGRGAGGILLGDPVDELPPPTARVQLHEAERSDYPSVSVWVRQGLVDQVGVRAGYAGKLLGSLAIGTSIQDVARELGTVTEDDEDNLIVPGSPGWCFETEAWTLSHKLEDNRASRITEIFVHMKR